MKVKQCLCVLAITLLIAGCGSAERKANKSVAKVNNERLSLIKDYEKCIKKAGEDEVKSEACDTYLKAADALR
jgi:outer membrane biogenesis lipoprotein LolB